MNFTDVKAVTLTRVTTSGITVCEDWVVNEVPVVLIYNGTPHVVIMCTPNDLEDFVYGFSFTENIIQKKTDIIAIKRLDRDSGIEMYVEIDGMNAARLEGRKRQMSARTGCGICGLDSLLNVVRPLKAICDKQQFDMDAVMLALKNSESEQVIGQQTGAAHAAFLCDHNGAVILVREDVGRHVALDKLIGALGPMGFRDHFCLISSRASFEMVQKAISANCSLLVAMSAPTKMAIDLAKVHQLTLMGFAKSGRINVYSA